MRQKVEFQSGDHTLAGLLEIPANGMVAYAIFAHCFTCGKDIAAASRISRQLVARGIAVLRFDFTGLGNSDGDFSNTNFSSNIDDLVAAADYLRNEFIAPQILIGHSLGGAAVLNAAHRIAEVTSVVTIGAPADAQHVSKQFSCDIPTIEKEGAAEVSLAGRPFTIKKQFLDDIKESNAEHLAELKKALLIMHSPVDEVVSIEQAERIYSAAKHPKSFVSLNKSDHLVSDKEDAEYIAEVIAAWVTRYLPDYELLRQKQANAKHGSVVVNERNKQFTREIFSDSHHWFADEPTSLGGANLGPDPYEHLLAALGACTSMTIRMYANHKKWPLDNVQVELSHEKQHLKDCKDCAEKPKSIEVLARRIWLFGDLDSQQRERLIEIADRCPVHKTLTGQISITTKSMDPN